MTHQAPCWSSESIQCPDEPIQCPDSYCACKPATHGLACREGGLMHHDGLGSGFGTAWDLQPLYLWYAAWIIGRETMISHKKNQRAGDNLNRGESDDREIPDCFHGFSGKVLKKVPARRISDSLRVFKSISNVGSAKIGAARLCPVLPELWISSVIWFGKFQTFLKAQRVQWFRK